AIAISASSAGQLARLLMALRHPLVSVRRYERGFFHTKAVVVEPATRRPQAVVGSFNLTRAGLCSNIELGVATGRDTADLIAGLVHSWWGEAVPYELAELIEERFAV